MNYRNFIHRFGFIYRPIKKAIRDKNKKIHIYKDTLRLDSLMASTVQGKNRVFYLGITAHSNLGDMAQHYCITEWIKENYPDYELVMFESDTVVDSRFNFIAKFKKLYRECDIIIFQSGYTTQDLGGNHEEMHRLICDNISDAQILMMPQTIFFKKEENRQRCSKSYNQAKNMLFLARDFNSYEQAKRMFPSIRVMAFPDIVTTLIGKFIFNGERKGICMCLRDDGEKYYSNEDLLLLKNKLEKHTNVVWTDTKADVNYKELRSNKQEYIEKAISDFARYEVTITDRYHGTIFSLAAGTPVIIIKSNDHKVVTGADWFKGIYDDYVYVASDLEDAYEMCVSIRLKNLTHHINTYFDSEYYSQLKKIFNSISKC